MILLIVQLILAGVLIFDYVKNWSNLTLNDKIVKGLETFLQIIVIMLPYTAPLLPILVI